MHSVEELGNNVPAFLAKLWKMVEDPETNDLIGWSPNGSSFFIRNQSRFSRELLPLYYKHNNMASFVRQLNMYGFHKVVSIEGGGLKLDRDEMEFAHKCFLMGHPYLLEHIKRKIASNKSEESRTGSKPELVNKVLTEVKSLKGRQDSVDSQLSAMKRENEVLWREVAILRQKHLKQQQIVNKLIQFLVSMVQTSRGSGIGIKRHYPLMLSDITHRPSKTARKMNGNIADMNSVPSNLSPTGPVIHELDPAELLEDCTPNTDDEGTTAEFLDSDLRSAVNSEERGAGGAASHQAEAPLTATVTVLPSAAGESTGLAGAEQEVLLELAQECPRVVLISPTPAANATATATAKAAKGRKSTAGKGAKRRKSRSASTQAKATNPMAAIKMEQDDAVDSVNVNNFLEIMLPTLVSEGGEAAALSEPGLLSPAAPQPSNAQQPDILAAALGSVAEAAAPASSVTGAGLPTAAVTGSASGEQCGTEEGEGSSQDLTLACADPNTLADPFKSKDDLDVHLDTMQSDLDSLKELLKGEGYNLDANMLLGLFGDDSLSYGIPLAQEESGDRQNKENAVSDPMVSGSELMAYSTNLLDLTDMSGLDDWVSPTPTSLDSISDSCSEVNTPLVTPNSPAGSSCSAGKKNKKK